MSMRSSEFAVRRALAVRRGLSRAATRSFPTSIRVTVVVAAWWLLIALVGAALFGF